MSLKPVLCTLHAFMLDSETKGAVAKPTLRQEVNELLCFIQQKCNTLPYDDLLKICLDFYQSEKVENARELLLKYVSQ